MKYFWRILAGLLVCGLLFVFTGIAAKAEPRQEMAYGASGAELWSQNCNRCHNIPSPADYSDEQWSVLVNAMRDMGNILAADARKILAFLQSAN